MGVLNSFRPHQSVSRVADINLDELRAKGLRALLLDLDNTIALWRQDEIAAPTREWIERAKRSFSVCLVSNAISRQRVRRIAEQLGVPYVHGIGPWGKPWPSPYRRAMRLTGTQPQETAMIGDQLWADILGARRLGLCAILVEPVGPRELLYTSWLRRWARRIEAKLRRQGHWPAPGALAYPRASESPAKDQE